MHDAHASYNKSYTQLFSAIKAVPTLYHLLSKHLFPDCQYGLS